MLSPGKTAHKTEGMAEIRPGAKLFGGGALLALAALGCSTEGRILWESATDSEVDAGTPTAEAGGSATADAGIPATVVLTGQTATGWHGGDGGTPYTDTCPDKQVVIGYQGATFGDGDGGVLLTPVVSVIQAVCGTLSVAGPPSDPVAVTPGSPLTARGMMQTAAWSQMCPAEQVVVGFSGRSGNFVDRLAFMCAHWIVSIHDGGASLSADSLTTLPAAGGLGGIAFPLEMCPAGQMATGSRVRAGFYVDQFALLCSTPLLLFADAGR
jgi:hypothetical protein